MTHDHPLAQRGHNPPTSTPVWTEPVLGDDLYRLYHEEWTIAATGTEEHCCEFFQSVYHKRVKTDDWQIRHDTKIDRYRLWVRMPVLKGEFKLPNAASRWAEDQGLEDYTIVVRNSPADHDLRAYGRRKLK